MWAGAFLLFPPPVLATSSREKRSGRDRAMEGVKGTSIAPPLRLSTLLFIVLLPPLLLLGEVASQEFGETAAGRTLKQDVDHTFEVHCSRERSRAAWKIIEEYLMPFLEKEQYNLSSKCKLHPDSDMFREQEQHKIYVDDREWRCGFCRKSFYSEKYLDQHFNNRHSNLLNDTEGRCLANVCGALHCDLVMESKKPPTKCNPAAAARNQHMCESLADSCFPINQSQSARRLHELFLHQFCDSHTCSGGRAPFSRGGRKDRNIFYLAICILILMLLPLFYLIALLQTRESRKVIGDFKRISKLSHKKKPT